MRQTRKLLEGFQRFKARYFAEGNSLYDRMKTSQPAKTLLIACCDSRVDPAILTDADPGDLFIVRNVANLVPPCEGNGGDTHHGTSSALEFAVKHLKVENIIVMGHANCGGIRAMWQDTGKDGQSQYIHKWVSIAKSAKEWVLVNHENDDDAVKLRACEQRSVLVSLRNLMTFDAVKERVNSGELTLHGWYFDLAAGELLSYNAELDDFELATNQLKR